MQKNLHIFNDQLGFFTNKTVAFIQELYPDKNIFLNTADHCKNKISSINYSSVKEFLKIDQNSYKLVIFHSYNYANKDDLKAIKNKFKLHNIKFAWVFWSHEYYQLPEFFTTLYQGFSRQYYLRKKISYHIEHFLKFCKGQVRSPFYLGLNSFKNSFKEFDVMASLIKDDYNYVMHDFNEVKYQFVSYISLLDFPNIDVDFSIQKNDIMVGHSGSPILNHYEIIKKLSDMNIKNKLYIPLAYGKKSYITKLQKAIVTKLSNLSITFQTDFISKDDYYKTIDQVGFFILNSYCQQALGNIFFFLWTGTKVFLREETSTYKTLKEKSFHIFSIEKEFDETLLIPLTIPEKQHNRQLVIDMINNEIVNQSWLRLLTINE